MPLYEYYCLDCRRVFDALRAYEQADAPISCASCHGTNTVRKLSLIAAPVRGTANGEATGNSGGCACGRGGCGCH